MRLRTLGLGFALISSLATIAPAAPIVDISPNAGTSFRVGGPNSQVETISWTQAGAFTSANISAIVGSEDGSPEVVTAYLTRAIGAGAGSPVATATVTVGAFANDATITTATFFSGLSLGAGSYHLTLFNPDTTGNVNIRWARGTTVTFGTGVTGNGEYFTNLTNGTPNTTTPYQSTFVTSNLYDNAFTVTGTPALVPEPASILLVSAALATLGLASRSRRA